MGLTEEERQARVRQIQADKAKEAAEREAVKRRIAEDNVRAPRAALRRARLTFIHVLTSPDPMLAGGAAPAAGARDRARRRGGGRRWAFRARLRGRGAGRRRAAARDRGRRPRASRRVQGG